MRTDAQDAHGRSSRIEMKPVAFEYERPITLADAARLLGQERGFSKVLAGGQSLGPMLNLRLAQPDLLVDITSIPELTALTDEHYHLEIGACVTHADIEDGRIPDYTGGLLRHVAGRIAYRAVRNRGTIGGSIAHADPAADWVSALALADAQSVVWTNRGSRSIAVADLIVSSFTTVLEPNELIRSIRVPKLSSGARWGFYKFSQKAGEFAHAIGGVLHDPARGTFRAVIGAIETAPIVVPDATSIFAGGFGPDLADRVDRQAVLQLLDGKSVTDEYIRSLALVALKRAAKQACAS
jgi:aerobic carbon-monoxide dehydrogenase medium subunit